jgi:hypothetical protein
MKLSLKKTSSQNMSILETYESTFSTAPLQMQVTKQEFYIDPRDPKSKKILVNLQFNYPVNAEDFKKRVEFELKTEGVNLLSSKVESQVTFNKYFTEAYLQSATLQVVKENQKMLVKIEKGTKPQGDGPGSEDYQNIQISVPGLYEAFKIGSVSAILLEMKNSSPNKFSLCELQYRRARKIWLRNLNSIYCQRISRSRNSK